MRPVCRFGYNVWRDPQKPTKILEKLCQGAGLATPIYRPGSVEVAGQNFYADEFVENVHGLTRCCHDNNNNRKVANDDIFTYDVILSY